MAQVVIMPKQGQSVESCIVTEFKKKPGDKVEVGDILFTYETDKASFEEDAKVAGTVLACFFQDNDEIPCLTNVMVIGEPGESFAEFAPGGEAPAAQEPAQAEPAQAAAPAAAPAAAEVPAGTVTAGAPVSPRARKLASEKGIDTAQVAGTGPGGRIIERDVQAAAATPRTGLAKAMTADGSFQAPERGTGLAGMVRGSDLKVWQPMHTDIAGEGEEFTVEKMSNMRKLIAKSMYNSLQNTAQLTGAAAQGTSRDSRRRRPQDPGSPQESEEGPGRRDDRCQRHYQRPGLLRGHQGPEEVPEDQFPLPRGFDALFQARQPRLCGRH